MVSSQTIEVILRAKDQLTATVDKVNQKLKQTGTNSKTAMNESKNATNQATQALNQQKTKIDNVGQQYNGLKGKVTQAFNSIKNTINNTKPTVDTKGLTTPFNNAAETIKNKWRTAMQNIQSNKARPTVDTSNLTQAEKKIVDVQNKIKQVNNIKGTPRFDLTQVTQADGKIKVVLKDLQNMRNYPVSVKVAGGGSELNQLSNILEKVYQREQKLNNSKVDIKVSNAGLSTLNGQITTATEKVNTMGNALNRLGSIAPGLASKLGTAFANIQNKVAGLKNKLGTLTSSMSMLSGTIMSAFGVVGVTSLSQFTIGAAIARQKLNAVTTSITGSEQATKSLNSAISKATNGGIVGFTKVAQAVQQIGIKYQLSNKQLEATAPVLNKIGTLARAMGKDGETAANLMSKAYDGLNGNFMLLKRNLGITKEQLIDAGWSGAANDIDGYTLALEKVLDKKPEMQEYLNSYEGQMERLKLAIQGVGRQIGEIFLPILNQLLGGFLELHKNCPWLTTALVVMAIAFVALASAAMIVLPLIELLTIKIGEQTIAQRLLNIEILKNPYVWIAVAIIALIAVMWHLYNTNESVRQAFDHMAQVIQYILGKAWETLWKIIQPLIPTFEHLMQVLGRLWQVITGQNPAVDEAGKKMDTWGQVANALAWILETVITWIVKAVEIIVAVLIPALDLLINILSAIINFVTSVIEAFGLLAQGDFMGFIQTFLEAFGTLGAEILTYLGQFVIELLNNIGVVLFGADAQFGTWLYNFILNGVQGAIDFVTGFINGICQLPGQLWTWLWQCITNTINWAVQMKDKFVQGAIDAVNGFIQWISTLPGKLWTWLWNTIQKVIAWASDFVNKVKETAKSAVDKFKEKLNLKKIVQDEINYIADCLKNAVGWLAQLAWDLATGIWESFKNAFKQNSPGLAANVVISEVGFMAECLTENQSLLAGLARDSAEGIVEGFTSSDINGRMLETLENSLPEDMYGETTSNMKVTSVTDNMSLSSQLPENVGTTNTLLDTVVNTDMTSITSDILGMTSTVNPQLSIVSNTLDNMGTVSTNMTNKTLTNNQALITGYNNMSNAISNTMSNIQQTNITGWNNVKNTTTSSLNSMLNSTKSVTAQMVSAWQSMKNSIIQAANDIKTQSEGRFNSLWSTIKTFYNRIQHPGGAGAPVRSRRTGGSSNGFKAFSNALRGTVANKTVGSTVSRGTLIQNGFNPQDINYILPRGTNNLKVSDIENYLNFMIKAGAGGWSNIVSPNVKWIRDTTNKWKTAPPTIINKYKTSKGFRVGDFENGEPNITFSDFKQMAEDVFSQCHYDFYWDSSKYGNWITAFHAGYMNCDDSTEALMAMARACGLSAEKVHGHWNSYGHYWANIAGHKMDTTGWMQHRNWTPSQSHAGPVPRSQQVLTTENNDTSVIIDLLLEIISYLQGNDDKQYKIIHEGKVQYDFKHDITGSLPDGISAEDVEAIIDAHAEDSQFLKRIAGNREFQERFNNMSNKLIREKERFM